MALPMLNDGYEVTDVEWNAHVTEINRLLDKPHARYYQNRSTDNGQTLTTGENTPIEFDLSVSTHPGVSINGANTVLTFNRPGVWEIHAAVRILGGGGGERYCAIQDDTTATLASDNNYPGSSNVSCVAPSTTRRFDAGESIRVVVFQSSGGPLQLSASFQEAIHVAVTWMCP